VTDQGNRLIRLDDVSSLSRKANLAHHKLHLNPRLTNLLEIMQADIPLVRAAGSYVWDAEGNKFLDFFSGFAALNLGHNPPHVIRAIDKVRLMPNLVEGVSLHQGALAYNLAQLAPGGLNRVFFANSGAEVVDASIKLARASTGRTKLVACQSGFHGRSIGALSLMNNPDYHDPFLPLLQDVILVPFGDTQALEGALCSGDVASFIVEPIQGEAGMIVPPSGYLRHARELCTRYGSLLVMDEIQTGMARTGTMFAIEHEEVIPDVLLIGKSLGGGVMPLSALLTTETTWNAAKGGTPRSPFHTSTFGGNTWACAAGLATLEVILDERLAERAASSGAYLMERLRQVQARCPIIRDVRGRGLMIGIELAPATRYLPTLAMNGMLNELSRKYFSSLIIAALYSEYRVFTAFTLNNPNVLRVQPPLCVREDELNYFVDSLENTLRRLSNFPKAAIRFLPRLIRALHA
jgi:putrescine aminotransferase